VGKRLLFRPRTPEPELFGSRRPPKRAEDLSGKRFGRLVVLGEVRRLRGDGRTRRCWRARCDCGAETTIEAFELQRAAPAAAECKACANRRAGRARAAKVGGATILELAQRAGVSHIAIRQRIAAGWPAEQLAAPATRTGRAA
jgi:hypothetical protein